MSGKAMKERATTMLVRVTSESELLASEFTRMETIFFNQTLNDVMEARYKFLHSECPLTLK